MQKLKITTPGAFRESAKRFTELRKRRITEAEVFEIIENAKNRKNTNRPSKKIARHRDVEA